MQVGSARHDPRFDNRTWVRADRTHARDKTARALRCFKHNVESHALGAGFKARGRPLHRVVFENLFQDLKMSDHSCHWVLGCESNRMCFILTQREYVVALSPAAVFGGAGLVVRNFCLMRRSKSSYSHQATHELAAFTLLLL